MLVEGEDSKRQERLHLLELRERLAHLLVPRLQLVRQAAGYVFRRQREILQEVADHQHRQERAARRRAMLINKRRRQPLSLHRPDRHPLQPRI